MKIQNLVLLLMISINISAYDIARIDEHYITSEQLNDKMQEFEGDYDLTYDQIYDLALEELINERLLTKYAKMNDIVVEVEELESYFINLLGNDPRFKTNGLFDYSKFNELKQTSQIQKILSIMEKDILLGKVRSVIESSFNLTEKKIIEQYIINNTKIDLNYALINLEDAGSEIKYSPELIFEYFQKNKHKFKTEKKVKLSFFIVQNQEFVDSVKTGIDLQIRNIASEDTTLTPSYLDNLRTKLSESETKERAQTKALDMLEKLESQQPIPYVFLETEYLGKDKVLGKLPKAIINKAFTMKRNTYSNPIDIGIGYLVFSVIDKKKPDRLEIHEIPNKVWKSYLESEILKPELQAKEVFFIENLDKFLVNAAVISMIEIPKNRTSRFSKNKTVDHQNIISEIELNLSNNNKIDNLISQYNLNRVYNVVYLDKFKNPEDIENEISEKINVQQFTGFIDQKETTMFYKVSSLIDDYIPDYEKIKSQFDITEVQTRIDTTIHREYYEFHKKDFMSPDSLQIGGVFIPFETDSIFINYEAINEYYENNSDRFYRKRAVKFNYIFSFDKHLAQKIRTYLLKGIDTDLLDFCFGDSTSIPKKKIIEYAELPVQIKDKMSEILDISYPIKLDDGWIVIKKEQEFPAGIVALDEVFDEIKNNLQLKIAKENAFKKAQTVFDSTTYFSQCYKHIEDDYIFKSDFQKASEKFPPIGDISVYRKELMRIWQNEKISRIIKTDSGYAVIFLLKKKNAEQLSYEQSVDLIKERLIADEKYLIAKQFVTGLKEKIIENADPDSLLFFLGGWKRGKNLTLSSNIPGIAQNKVILDDISKREEGYYSPVMKISDKQLMFYYIDKMEKKSREFLQNEMENIKQEVIDKKFKEWFEIQKTKADITIF